MPKKTNKPEEIVAKLRQVDVLVSQGQSLAEAVRLIGVTYLLPVAQGVWWAAVQPGEAGEGAGEEEQAAQEGRFGHGILWCQAVTILLKF